MFRSLIITLALISPGIASAKSCGGTFAAFLQGIANEAQAHGIDPSVTKEFLDGAQQDAEVLKADRAQGVFQKPFLEFSRHLISGPRLDKGRQLGQKHAAVFNQIAQEYGLPKGVLLAFWAFETDYGSYQGNFNTRNALLTLAHDCRRPDLFRPQIFAALELYAQGRFPKDTTGAWAGETGMVQMLPEDIITYGRDGDGDGDIDLKGSAADALLSGAAMLSGFGWRPDEPWIQEVTVPDDLDWSLSGLTTTHPTADWENLGVRARVGDLPNLPASLILPQGHRGPAFLAYPNFHIYFDWNQSFTYVLTAAYFATRLEGASVYEAGAPDPGLKGPEMKQLQTVLQAKGYDVGKIDGILGAKTRAAVQIEQQRLGLPADAWPTPALLSTLAAGK